ncbi:hypothetical protein [uncultured Treponema sp.]|uniref:hypothetical protein n=1 Tax=uncultured Treponema sp. TaxID=162155 RepID=UPI0025F4686F|nr:hypothetical protein [uncultured Treponema sp.]
MKFLCLTFLCIILMMFSSCAKLINGEEEADKTPVSSETEQTQYYTGDTMMIDYTINSKLASSKIQQMVNGVSDGKTTFTTSFSLSANSTIYFYFYANYFPAYGSSKTYTWGSGQLFQLSTTSTFKLTEDSNSRTGISVEEEGTYIFTFIPSTSTVTITKKETASTSIVNAVFDLTNVEKMQTAFNSAGIADMYIGGKPTNDAEFEVDGSGAKLVILSDDKRNTLKFNEGLKIGTSDIEGNVLQITVDSSCTIQLMGCGTTSDTSWSTGNKPNSFSINGEQIYKRQYANETDIITWSYNFTNSGSYIISASGMMFVLIECHN